MDAEGFQWNSRLSACKRWLSSGSRTPFSFKKRSKYLRRMASGSDLSSSMPGIGPEASRDKQASSSRRFRAMDERFSPIRGFSSYKRGMIRCRIRLRRKVSSPLELSSMWARAYSSRNASTSRRVTLSIGRITLPLTGAMAPSPLSPVPLSSRISTVSALSSAVWAVATFPGRDRKKRYRASRAAASSPFSPGTTFPLHICRGIP